jgi:large subunit ribosomal protein L2
MDADRVLIKLPSGAMKHFDARCRATVGCLAGGGRLEKPLLKAGKGHYKNIARGHWYPMVRGNKMNAGEHPFGGKQHHGAITPRGVGGSPGQHVGSFGSRRTGRKKR